MRRTLPESKLMASTAVLLRHCEDTSRVLSSAGSKVMFSVPILLQHSFQLQTLSSAFVLCLYDR